MIERQVGSRENARTVAITRVYDTTVEDLWDACTSPERLPRWFLPVSGDLRLGGRYAFEGNASGTITACEPPHAVDATWEFGGQTSWVELRLEADGERARLRLEHIAEVGDDIWEQYGPGAVGVGWDLGLHSLDRYLAGAPLNQDFQLSAEGRALSIESSEAWGEASIAAGTDPEVARGAAARTTAAYAGE
jgi:uncharacterized protein YndB with AHSA1/START domain